MSAPEDGGAVVALIGARCVGKSSVGALLAQRLGRPFLDLDQALAQGGGPSRTAGELLRELGEPAFRELEAATLEQVLARAEALVLATGGGSVERERSRTLLAQRAFCVWLRADAEVLGQRLAADPTERPALEGGDAVEELGRVLARREPLYAELADLVIDTDPLDIEQVVGTLLAGLDRS